MAIDTSTHRGGIAVFSLEGAEPPLLARRSYDATKGHAERLLSEIDAALRDAGASARDVAVVAPSVGPGAFTGVRVAVATAKGLALANGARIASVTSLETMAAASNAHAVRVPLLDAKRSECFAAAYAEDGTEVAAPTHLRVADVVEWAKSHGRDVVLLGEAVALLPPHDLPVERGDATDLPDPVVLGKLAARRAAAGRFDDAGSLQPTYVRPPDAVPLDRPDPRGLESFPRWPWRT